MFSRIEVCVKSSNVYGGEPPLTRRILYNEGKRFLFSRIEVCVKSSNVYGGESPLTRCILYYVRDYFFAGK